MTGFTVGTRGSALATTQTGTVATALSELSGLSHELTIIRTEGDVTTGSLASLGGTGVFASALRAAILDHRVDLAVHSLKDLPAAQPDGLEIRAIPPRVDVRDALCARDGLTLDELPAGARVGTGSPRRVAQLLALRPDLELIDIRGNVQTRLARVPGLEHHDDHAPAAAGSPRGDLDAVILACAGLDRVGFDWAITERIDTQRMLPAPGQGSLAIETRPDLNNAALNAAMITYDDAETRLQVTAERALLSRLEAGCAAPLGALGRVLENNGETVLELEAVVAALDGSRVLRRVQHVQIDSPSTVDPHQRVPETLLRAARDLGTAVAEALLDDGADLLPTTR